MTVAQLVVRGLKGLDEDDAGGFYTSTEVVDALNEAQRLFVLLTLCLETTGTLALTAGTCWYYLLTEFPSFLLPLRVRITGNGAKLRPQRLAELDALDPAWQATAGTPESYAQIGFSLFGVYKQPADVGTSLDVTYAQCPTTMAIGATPQIPEEHHLALVDGALPILRMKEGGQEFAKTVPRFDRFLEAATSMANYVRARNLGQRYDRVPFEIEKFDRSKLIALAMKRERPASLKIPQAEGAKNG